MTEDIDPTERSTTIGTATAAGLERRAQRRLYGTIAWNVGEAGLTPPRR